MSLRWPNGFISANYDPLKTPGAPTIGTATSASPTSVSVTFTAPSNVGGGAITSYIATAKKTSDGTTVSGTGSSSPVTISGLTTGSAYTVTVAAVNAFGPGPSSAASNSVTPLNQYLYTFGRNNQGQLGLGDTVDRSVLTQVGASGDWKSIAGGLNFSIAIKLNGSLWSWGYGGNALGQGDNTGRSSPAQVGLLTNWSKVSSGGNFSQAIKTDGTLWTWGGNVSGQLGIGSTSTRASPVQVGALTNWETVACAKYGVIAIKTDGTLWAWGGNGAGQLGLNDTVYRSSPIQVGALTTWANVSCGYAHVLAVKTDGTLWAWGIGNNGPLGINNTYSYSSPKQVGALTTWSKPFVRSSSYSSFVTKTNGTLWVWGRNGGNRCLGLGDGYNRSSPVQLGALTNWSQLSNVEQGSLALKTDGTLWAWGYINKTTVNYSSPVQLGSSTTWISVGCGEQFGFGILGS